MSYANVSNVSNTSSSMDLNIDPESFFYGIKFTEKACSASEDLVSSFSGVDNALANELGYDIASCKSLSDEINSTLSSLLARMNNTKALIERMDASNIALFESISSQFDLSDMTSFGEMDETDYAIYMEDIKNIYDVAIKKDPSKWSQIELQAVSEYYRDLQERYSSVEDEYNKEIGWLINGETATSEKEYKELKNEKKELESFLKQHGLIEKSGWDDIKDAVKHLINEGSQVTGALYSGDIKTAAAEFVDFGTQLVSTGAVVGEKLIAGAGKVLEWTLDGTVLLETALASTVTGAVDLVAGTNYTKQMWNDNMEAISKDAVGIMEDKFYNDTVLGKTINENSALKYDSAGAEIFKNIGTKAVEIVGATAITIATGGIAAPFVAAGVGFLEGTGQGAESQFSMVDENGNYTGRDALGVGLSLLQGLGKASEWYGYGQTGIMIKNSLPLLKDLNNLSIDKIKEIIGLDNEHLQGLFSREQIKNTTKKVLKGVFTDIDTYVDMGTGVFNFVTTGLSTNEWDWKGLLFDEAYFIGGNIIGAIGNEYLSFMQRKFTDNIEQAASVVRQERYMQLPEEVRAKYKDLVEKLSSIPEKVERIEELENIVSNSQLPAEVIDILRSKIYDMKKANFDFIQNNQDDFLEFFNTILKLENDDTPPLPVFGAERIDSLEKVYQMLKSHSFGITQETGLPTIDTKFPSDAYSDGIDNAEKLREIIMSKFSGSTAGINFSDLPDTAIVSVNGGSISLEPTAASKSNGVYKISKNLSAKDDAGKPKNIELIEEIQKKLIDSIDFGKGLPLPDYANGGTNIKKILNYNDILLIDLNDSDIRESLSGILDFSDELQSNICFLGDRGTKGGTGKYFSSFEADGSFPNSDSVALPEYSQYQRIWREGTLNNGYTPGDGLGIAVADGKVKPILGKAGGGDQMRIIPTVEIDGHQYAVFGYKSDRDFVMLSYDAAGLNDLGIYDISDLEPSQIDIFKGVNTARTLYEEGQEN